MVESGASFRPVRGNSNTDRHMKRIRVTIWNENMHERDKGAWADLIRTFYPAGIHNALAEGLAADDLEIAPVSLEMPEQGLPQELLALADILPPLGAVGRVPAEPLDVGDQRILPACDPFHHGCACEASAMACMKPAMAS